MALATINRGGRFVEDHSARAGLRYEPSGREPRLVVASGRGYPYLPKSEYHSLPPQARLRRLRAALESASAQAAPVSFGTQIWPALVRDAYALYYEELDRVRPAALEAPVEEILRLIDAADLEASASPTDIEAVPAALNAELDGLSREPFDMLEWIAPLRGASTLDRAALTSRVAGRLERDIAEAVAAWDSPLKAALWEISSARRPTQLAMDNGRVAEADRLTSLRSFLAFGQMVGSGPPLFRTRELLALVDAGLVTFLGDRPTLTAAGGNFTLTSSGRSVTAHTLADAFLPGPDIRHAADPLTRSLLDADRVRPFTPHDIASPAPETDAVTRRTVHPDGSLDPRLHIAGIPTGGQWADTTISPLPGTDAPSCRKPTRSPPRCWARRAS